MAMIVGDAAAIGDIGGGLGSIKPIINHCGAGTHNCIQNVAYCTFTGDGTFSCTCANGLVGDGVIVCSEHAGGASEAEAEHAGEAAEAEAEVQAAKAGGLVGEASGYEGEQAGEAASEASTAEGGQGPDGEAAFIDAYVKQFDFDHVSSILVDAAIGTNVLHVQNAVGINVGDKLLILVRKQSVTSNGGQDESQNVQPAHHQATSVESITPLAPKDRARRQHKGTGQ